jgi:hypothetical protein
MREQFLIGIDIVLSNRNRQTREVNRNVKKTEEDERKLSRNRFDHSNPIRFLEVCPVDQPSQRR